jgi:hypothetical protein
MGPYQSHPSIGGLRCLFPTHTSFPKVGISAPNTWFVSSMSFNRFLNTSNQNHGCARRHSDRWLQPLVYRLMSAYLPQRCVAREQRDLQSLSTPTSWHSWTQDSGCDISLPELLQSLRDQYLLQTNSRDARTIWYFRSPDLDRGVNGKC